MVLAKIWRLTACWALDTPGAEPIGLNSMKTKWLPRALVGLTWLAFGLRVCADAGATWQTFTDPKGRFSLLMPGQPEYKVSETPAQDGSVLVHTDMYLVNVAETLYVAGATTYSANINTEKELTADRDNFDKAVGAQVTSQQRLKFQDYPALEFKSFNAQANCYFSVLSVVVGNHSYMVAARYYTANEPANVTRYLQSYKLISP
ncbi:MAG TPA: hypothetical protein VNW23_07875 [Opitutaceae bacterium]|jgi:hypothetical protein|nr:hypothetical protein [Opitutaceae bacterium]